MLGRRGTEPARGPAGGRDAPRVTTEVVDGTAFPLHKSSRGLAGGHRTSAAATSEARLRPPLREPEPSSSVLEAEDVGVDGASGGGDEATGADAAGGGAPPSARARRVYHGRTEARARALREKAAARLASRHLNSEGLTAVDRRSETEGLGDDAPATIAAAAAASEFASPGRAAVAAAATELAARGGAAAGAQEREPEVTVPELLARRGLGEYSELFRAEALEDVGVLRAMARDAEAFRRGMRDIGITKLGHREALLQAVLALE